MLTGNSDVVVRLRYSKIDQKMWGYVIYGWNTRTHEAGHMRQQVRSVIFTTGDLQLT